MQCFTYDHHCRLVDAWSQTSVSGATDAASATLGGPAAYGQTYTYDGAGNRTTLTDHMSGVTTSEPEPGSRRANLSNDPTSRKVIK